MSEKRDLAAAKLDKKDEFYTQLTDIEKEMRYYRKHFQGKTVLCNCDDPFESNFFKYFVLNFNRLGLKKLIATCYASSPIMGSQLQYCIGKDGQMSFSFGDEPAADENAKHPYELPQIHYTVVRVSSEQMGIAGDDSWGARTHEEFLVDVSKKKEFTFTFQGIEINPLFILCFW